MDPNGSPSDSHVPKIKIEPGLPSTPAPSSKKVTAKSAAKRKSRPAVSPGASASGNASTILAVKIKTEPGLISQSPGTSEKRPEAVPTPSTSGNATVQPVVKIKTEPGITPPIAHPTRLTSFRPARDLTLTGNLKPEKANKRIFTPNLNVQRNKKKEDGTTSKTETGARGRARGRGRGQNDRGRGRGRGATNVTQSTGVFSEGISEVARAARRMGGSRSGVTSDREARAQLERPKLNLNISIDKADEEEKLKLLLRDDFIDDGGGEIDTDNIPISLPLMKQLELFKNESDGDVPVKNEAVDSKGKIDAKPILENGKAVMPPERKNVKNTSAPTTLSVPDVIENESNGYMVLRFPDCLPGLQSYDDTHDQNNHHRNYNEKKPPDNIAENKNKTDYCTLRSLKAGHLGKLQIHQSGKARLLLGDNSLVVDMGSRLGFRQDVVAAKVDGLNKELVNLGRVTSTLVCTPDFESILAEL